jgi:flagellar FliJ protein
MKKFKFPLEAVEKVRSQAENRAMEALSHQQRIYQQKLADKQNLLSRKTIAFTEKNEMLSRDSNINEIRLQEEHITGLNYQLVRADQAIVRARRFLEHAMREYIKARRERMMMDRLKEKALTEHKKENQRIEQKNLDDLITMRARLNHGPVSDADQEEADLALELDFASTGGASS